eukprot:NODE_66_length_25735_cov_0.318497.p1 type:complete len:617 gc:universal NODE_66_length_25735_cov_0.318497:1780-3630(+)
MEQFPSFSFKVPTKTKPKKKEKKLYYFIDKKGSSPKFNRIKYNLFCKTFLGKVERPTILKYTRYFNSKLFHAIFVPRCYESLLNVQPLQVEIEDRPTTNKEVLYLHQMSMIDPTWFKYNAFHPKNIYRAASILEKALIHTPSKENWQHYLFALQLQEEDASEIQFKFTESFVLFEKSFVNLYFDFVMSTFDLFNMSNITDILNLSKDQLIITKYIECLKWMDFHERAFVLVISLYLIAKFNKNHVKALFESDDLIWDEIRDFNASPAYVKDFGGDDPERIVLYEDIDDYVTSFPLDIAGNIVESYLMSFGYDIFWSQPTLNITGIPDYFYHYKFDKDIKNCELEIPNFLYPESANFLGSTDQFVNNFKSKLDIPLIPFLHFNDTNICKHRIEIMNHLGLNSDLKFHDQLHTNEQDALKELSKSMKPKFWRFYLLHLFKKGEYVKARNICKTYLTQVHEHSIYWIQNAIELFAFKNKNLEITLPEIENITYESHYWVCLTAFSMVVMNTLSPQSCHKLLQKVLSKYPVSDVWLFLNILESEYLVPQVIIPHENHYLVQLIKSWIQQKCPKYYKNSYIYQLRIYFGKKDNQYLAMNDIPYDANIMSEEIKEEKGFRIC